MRAEILLLLLGMSLVTYIPRALPAALTQKMRFGRRFEKFLRLIPYTAMAALIFTGVLFVDEANILIGLAGGAVAAVLAFKKCPVMVCVLAAIATDLLLYSIF